MGEICDVCSENQENQRFEYDQEVVAPSKSNRLMAMKTSGDAIETTQRMKNGFQKEESIWDEKDNEDDGSIKNRLHLMMTMNLINEEESKSKQPKPNKDSFDNGNNSKEQCNNSLYAFIYNLISNLDNEGYTQSQMIPFQNDIPHAHEEGGSGGCGGGFFPLQRYQYEELDLNNQIAAKKIKKTVAQGNFDKKNQTKKKLQNEDEALINKEDDINFVSTIQKPTIDYLTIFLTYPGTQIDKSLLKNPKELLISYEKIERLDENNVVFDGDIMKMSYQRTGCKITPKYLQITKDSFKYFNSISSQQVYKNRPLLKIAILDIEKIEISNDNLIKLKRNSVQFAFKIILDNNLSYDFGCDDPDYGANIISILTILKRFAYQRACEEEKQPDFKVSIDIPN